jgi:hypothetical protein
MNQQYNPQSAGSVPGGWQNNDVPPASSPGVHPELAKLLTDYDRISQSVADGVMSPDQAADILNALVAHDATGAAWGLDVHGNFTRRVDPTAPAIPTSPTEFSATYPAGGPVPFGGATADQPAPSAAAWGAAGHGSATHPPAGGFPPENAHAAGGWPTSAPAGAGAQPVVDGWGVPPASQGWGGQADPAGVYPPGVGPQPGYPTHPDASQWSGGPGSPPPKAGKGVAVPAAVTQLVDKVKRNKVTVAVVAVGLLLIAFVLAGRGGDTSQQDGVATDPTVSAPAAPAVPSAERTQQAINALTSADPARVANNVAESDSDVVAALEAAKWHGVARLGWNVNADPPVAVDGGASQRLTIVDANGTVIAVGEMRWVSEGEPGSWRLASWPSFTTP